MSSLQLMCECRDLWHFVFHEVYSVVVKTDEPLLIMTFANSQAMSICGAFDMPVMLSDGKVFAMRCITATEANVCFKTRVVL